MALLFHVESSVKFSRSNSRLMTLISELAPSSVTKSSSLKRIDFDALFNKESHMIPSLKVVTQNFLDLHLRRI